jgi:ribonuclease P protein component
MIGRLVHTADIARVLAVAPCSRSAHFAAHHVSAWPAVHAQRQRKGAGQDLSTDGSTEVPQAVDKSPAGHWIGCVVPKRHARRAVTRSLLKRQIRAALGRHAAGLGPGLWLVRLRQPFVKSQFPSAASAALASAARDELDRLLARAAA